MSFDQRIPLFIELGVKASSVPLLKRYIDLLWAANADLNLISRKMSFEDLIDNHVIDCLLPLRSFPSEVHAVADLGSGGGLPGVIYAIHFPSITFHLFEKSPKKQEFLRSCLAIAPNLQIHGEIPLNLNDIDLVTARAFKPLDVILDITRSYYLKGGKYFLLKGRREKIEEEVLLAKKKFKDINISIQPLKSPLLDVERNLVLF